MMTREELNEHIKELDATIGLGIHTNIVKAWLEDIRDNGIKDIKYTVQVIKGNCDAFLNVDEDDDTFFGDEREGIDDRTRFTKQEIEKLKQRDDLAIDWDKAIIEPVEAK